MVGLVGVRYILMIPEPRMVKEAGEVKTLT
ncbi:hypothetical protein ES702_05823 [subsurface metagenome]